MAIEVIDGFTVFNTVPIDSRTVVADLTARDAIDTNVRYEGLQTYVAAEQKTYTLIGGITNGNWQENITSGVSVWEVNGTSIYNKNYATGEKVGINDNTPTATLDIVGGASDTIFLRAASATTTNLFYVASLSGVDTIRFGAGTDLQRLSSYQDGFKFGFSSVSSQVSVGAFISYADENSYGDHIAQTCNNIIGRFTMRRYNGASKASYSALTSGNVMGQVTWAAAYGGYDNFRTGARMQGVVDETVTSTAVGSHIEFGTVALTTTTMITNMILSHEGYLGIGTNITQSALTTAAAKLYVVGNDLGVDYFKVHDSNATKDVFRVNKEYPIAPSYFDSSYPSGDISGGLIYISNREQLGFNNGNRFKRLGYAVATGINGAFTATPQQFIVADTSSAGFTITLPTAASAAGEKVIILLGADGNNLTVDGSGAETINGAANFILDTQYEYRVVMSTGTEWFIVGQNGDGIGVL